MAANYGISHYGYAQDFSSYWPNGYGYGDLIYTGFGEEVFFPSGSAPYSLGISPYDMMGQVRSEAPVHWSELMDNNLTYYGYYIADGPSYSILGPGGGYGGPCPVTEIPGPDINIQQFFAQYGCSVEVANESYFVIELAQVCPLGTGAKYG